MGRLLFRRESMSYLLVLGLLILIFTTGLNHVLPSRVAHAVKDESEALPIALLFCAFVQYVRAPRLSGRRALWPIVIGCALLSWAVAWVLLTQGLPSPVATLNESFVAVGAMVLYAGLPRPSSRVALALTLAGIAALVLFRASPFVVQQAESLVPVALIPVALDYADRTILSRSAPVTPSRTAWWCLLLVAVPVAARAHIDIGTWVDCLRYVRRATEGFVGLLLIHLYFSYLLGPRWRRTDQAPTSLAPPSVLLVGAGRTAA